MIVGRDRYLDAIERHLGAVAGGDSGFLAFVGEAGIGKTRLLRELSARARERDWLVLEGRGAELQRELPFAVVMDAFERHLNGLAPSALGELGGDQSDELSVLFGGFAQPGAEWRLENDAERYRLYRAVGGLIGRLAGERPLVLTLDDLHWADDASIELVGQLLRRPPAGPVLVALAYRSGRTPSRVERTVLAAAKEGVVDVMGLLPLTADEAERLLDRSLDSGGRRDIFTASGGNPFYLDQLARSASRREGEPIVSSPTHHERRVPPAVTAAIESEVDGLGTEAQELVGCGAVVGERFAIDVARAVAGLDEEATLSALDELLAAELVHPTAAPREFEFRHPIVHQAVYEQTAGGWRLAAHRRAALALAAAGAPVTARAAHVERCARRGDEDGIALLSEAGRAAATRAPAVAVRWYSAALRLLAPGAPPARHLALLGPLAAALAAVGRLEESRSALSEALELVPAEPPMAAVSLVGLIADLELLLGRPLTARRTLADALAALDVVDSPAAATLQLALAREGWRSSDPDAITSWAGKAGEIASRLEGDQGALLRMGARSLIAVAECVRGNIDAAGGAADEAARIVDGLSDETLATRMEVLVSVGFAELSLERFAAADRHLGRGVAILRKTNQSYAYASMMSIQAFGRLQRGHSDDAVEPIEAVIEASRLGRNDRYMAWGQYLRCRYAGLVGDLREALAAGEEAVKIAARSPHLFFGWLAHSGLGVVLIDSGETERGRAEILANAGGSPLALADATQRPWLYEPLARAALAERDLGRAEEWVERGEAVADELGLPGAHGVGHLARAQLLLVRGRFHDAVDSALAGAALLAESGHRLDAARARAVAGRALAAGGDEDRALAELGLAHAELNACGARRHRDEVARELRGLGRVVPRANGWHSVASRTGTLSARESEVAELVAEGLTNPQIAERLYVSKKTVETHVSHIFAKLGVPSRAAVARAIGGERADSGYP